MRAVRPSAWLWKPGGGYYTEAAADLAARPLLPDTGRLGVRRIADLFERHGRLDASSRVLEAGCGRSPWLPYLALRFGCRVAGVDLEPYAAELARANLRGAGARGDIVCGDAFDPGAGDRLEGRFDLVYSMGLIEHFDDPAARLAALARNLRPGGRILTTVPNLRGINWLLQRLADLETLRIHVIYDARRLRRVHEQAGFRTVAAGCAGFFDAFLSSAAGARSRIRRDAHRRLCRALNLCAEAWTRIGRRRGTPEMPWVAPHLFYVGETAGERAAAPRTAQVAR